MFKVCADNLISFNIFISKSWRSMSEMTRNDWLLSSCCYWKVFFFSLCIASFQNTKQVIEVKNNSFYSWSLLFAWINRIETSENVRWRVVADQIDRFGPDHPPHVHVVTHIDGTANTIASRPHQLKIETHTHTKKVGEFQGAAAIECSCCICRTAQFYSILIHVALTAT